MRESNKVRTVLKYCILFLFFVYLFSMPYFSNRTPFNYLVYFIFCVFAFFVVLYRFLYLKIKFDYRLLLLPAFASYACIGTIVFSHQFRVLLTVLLLSLSFVIFYLFLDCFENKRVILSLAVCSLILFSILFVLHYRNSILNFSERLGVDGYFDNINTIAYYFGACSVLSLYLALYFEKKWELIYLIPFIGTFALGLLSGSRSFLFTTVIASIVLFITRFRKKPLILIIGLASMVGAGVLFFTLPVFSAMSSRIIKMINTIGGVGYATDYSTVTRIMWQQYGLYIGTHHILFGVGVNGFAVMSGVGTYTHANIAELICDVGLIGLLIYYSVFFVALFDLFTKKFKHKDLVICLLSFVFVREFFGVPYTSKFNAFVFALLVYLGSKGVSTLRSRLMASNNYYVLEI